MKTNTAMMITLGLTLLTTTVQANNNLNTSYRAGSVNLPSADDNSASSSSAVSANQGRVGYRVPIVTPPGKAGLQPDVALVYGGSRRESAVGAGWTVPIPHIRVRTHGRSGQPEYGVAATILGFTGEPLIETGPSPDIDGDGLPETTFREERDTTYVRYIELSGGGYRADYANGVKLTLGQTAATQIARAGTPGHIAAWLPETRTDLLGNELVYTWASATAIDATSVSPSARYLTSIRYGCQMCAAAAYYQEVRFEYGKRSNLGIANAHDFSRGFPVETELYVQRIITASHGTIPSDVRIYTLGYDASGTRLLLTRVDTAGATAGALPTQWFTYTGSAAPATPSSVAAFPSVSFQTGVQPMDLDKDGRIDIVDVSSSLTARVFRNIGIASAAFDAAGSPITSTPGALPTIAHVSVEDTDRDLGIDVVDLNTGLGAGELFRHNGASGWAAGQSVTLPVVAVGDSTARIDVNLDGHVDLVDTTPGSDWTMYLNDGANDYTANTIACIAPATPAIVAPLSASDDGVLFGDVNADGVTDVVYLDGTSNAYFFPGRGRDCWGYRVEDGHGLTSYDILAITSVAGAPIPANTRLADVNGDGFADLVEITQPSSINVWLYNPTTGWSDAGVGGPWVQTNNTFDGCRIADFDHDGIRETLCSSGWQLYDLADQRPHMLETIDNGRGVVTEIAYTTTARAAASDDSTGQPWTRNVAAAIPVVERIAVDDSRGHLLWTQYGYRDAYYESDAVMDRFEFTGFGAISETVTPLVTDGAAVATDPADPGVLRRTFYDVGDSDWYLRGMKTCEQRWPIAANPGPGPCGDAAGALRYTSFTNRVDADPSGFVRLLVEAEDTFILEGNATGAQLRTERVYDSYGNVTRLTEFGQTDPHNVNAGNDERMTETDYVIDVADWHVRLAKRIRRGGIDAAGQLEVLAIDYRIYDGAATWDTNTITAGLLTRMAAWDHNPVTGSNATLLVEERTFTANGQVDTVTNAEGVVVDTNYDLEFGLFKTSDVTDPGGLNLQQQFTIDPRHGQITRVIAPDGNATEAGFDDFGRMTWVARPGDSPASPTLARTYSDGAPLSTWIDAAKDGTANGLVSTTWFDGNGNVVCRTSESTGGKLDIKKHSDYSARGVLALDIRPYRAQNCQSITISVAQGVGSRTTTKTHDARTVDADKRVLSLTHSDGSQRTWQYGVLTVTERDEEDNDPSSVHVGSEKTTTSDGAGRTIAVTESHLARDSDPGTHTFTYGWDAMSNPVLVTDSAGNDIYTAVYDSRNLLVRRSDADRGQLDTAYDAMNRPTTVTDARGEIVTYAYDAAGRIASVTTSEGTSTYHYDEAFDPADTTACHSIGRLAWVDDPSGQESFCYNTRGRTVRTDKVIDAHGPATLVTEKQFDAMDRITHLIHPDGTELQYRYGANGAVRNVGVRSGGTAYQLALVRYEPSGQVKTIDLGNGVQIKRDYDDRLRVSRIRATGASALQDLSIGYDNVGNIVGITDAIGFASMTAEYDDLYRLTSASGDRFGGDTATYRYDRLGNMVDKSFTDTSSPVHIGALTYGHPSKVHAVTQAGGQTYLYDATGNLEDDGNSVYSYTGTGKLKSVQDLAGTTVMDLEYDFNDERVVKNTASGDTVYYVREADAELRTMAGSTQWIKHVKVAGQTIARIEDTFSAATLPSHIFYVATDHMSSPTLVMDTAGVVIERAWTHPFGEENTLPLSAAGLLSDYKVPSDALTKMNHRFQGRESDYPGEFIDFGARVYLPSIGRFMTADTIIPDPSSGQSWNRYSFVQNNPLGFTDPSGNNEVGVNETAEPEADVYTGPGSVSPSVQRTTEEAQAAFDQGGPAYESTERRAATPSAGGGWHLGFKHQWIDGADGNVTVKLFGQSVTLSKSGATWNMSQGPLSGSIGPNGQDVGLTVMSVRGGVNNTGAYVGAGSVKYQCQNFSNCNLQSSQGITLGGVTFKPYHNGNIGGSDVSFKAFEIKGGSVFSFSSTATVKLRSNIAQTQQQILTGSGADHFVNPIRDALGGNPY